MSFFKKVGKVLKKVAKPVAKLAAFIPGPIGAVAKTVGALGGVISSSRGAASMSMALPAALPAAGRVLPGIGRAVISAGKSLSPTALAFGAARAVGAFGKRALRGSGGVAAGVGAGLLLDQFGNPVRRKRKINPLNHRALTRALRRVERAKKMASRLNRITIKRKDC